MSCRFRVRLRTSCPRLGPWRPHFHFHVRCHVHFFFYHLHLHLRSPGCRPQLRAKWQCHALEDGEDYPFSAPYHVRLVKAKGDVQGAEVHERADKTPQS